MEEYKIIDEYQILFDLWNEIDIDTRKSLLSDFVSHHRNLVLFSDISNLIAKKTGQKPTQINSLPTKKYISKLNSVLDLNTIETIRLFKYIIDIYCDKSLSDIKKNFLIIHEACIDNFEITSAEKDFLKGKDLHNDNVNDMKSLTDNITEINIDKLNSKIFNAKLNTTIELLKKYNKEDIIFLYRYLITVEYEYFSKNTHKILEMNFDEIKDMEDIDPNEILSIEDRIVRMKNEFVLLENLIEKDVLLKLQKCIIPDNTIPEFFNQLISEFNDLKKTVLDSAKDLKYELDNEEAILSMEQLENICAELKVIEMKDENLNKLFLYYNKFKVLNSKSDSKCDYIIKFKTKTDELISKFENNKSNKILITEELEKTELIDYEYNQLLRLINEPNVPKDILVRCKEFFGKELSYAAIEGDLVFENDSTTNSTVNPIEHDEESTETINTTSILNEPESIPNSTEKQNKDDSDENLQTKEVKKEIEEITLNTEHKKTIIVEPKAIVIEDEANSDGGNSKSIYGISDYEEKILNSVIVNLLNHNYSTSYILLNYLNDTNDNIRESWPDWTIELLTYSEFLGDVNDDFSDSIKSILRNFQELKYSKFSSSYRTGINLILLSSLLKPAIVSPVTDAGSILHYVKFSDNFTFLNKLCYDVQNFSNLDYPLSWEVMMLLNGKSNINSNYELLKEEVNEWMHLNKSTKIKYMPAEELLRTWLESDGLLYKIINPILDNNKDQKSEVDNLLKYYSNDYDIHKEINRAIKKLNNMNDSVTGTALTKLTSRVNSAKLFYQRWSDIISKKDLEKNDFKVSKIEEFYRSLINSMKEIKLKLIELSDKETELIILAGIKTLERTLNNLNNYFISNIPQREISLDPKEIVLINNYSVNTSDSKEKYNNETDRRKFICNTLIQSEDNIHWDQAVCNLFEVGDIYSFDKIYSYFENIDPESVNLKEWKKQRDKSIQEHEDKLKRMKDFTLNEVESSVMNMLLSETEREEFSSMISEKVSLISLDFLHEYEKLEKINCEINERKKNQKENFRLRLKEININEKFKNRISDCIDNGEIATASILIDAAERGDERNFDMENTDDLINFLNMFKPISDFLTTYDYDKSKIVETIENLEKGSTLGPLKLPLDENEFNNSRDILKLWFEIKNNKSDFEEKKLKQLFKWLGWDINYVKIENPLNRDIKSCIITFDNIPYCPLPTFGSDTTGRVKVFGIWNSSIENGLISSMRILKNQKTIILYFGRLNDQLRSEILNLSIKERLTFIVIDDTLFSYLTTVPGFKLKYLYKITFPFTYVKPYVTAASVLPKEMFFGRKKILEGLYNPHGPCIIYGGRQLGKTVILKKLEKEYNNDKEEIYVTYCDLKQKGLGEIIKESSHIWTLLGECLFNSGIIEKKGKVNNFRTANNFILGFLKEHSGSRILCLFDEADKFIELDSKNNFPVLTELNGIMRDSNGNFKFVLSGLHSVNKFSKISNSSISHLLSRGSVCIGPMIDNGEQKEARNLIVKPFSVMGFKFESEEVISQMLSLSNFYPSLIQLFNDKLLNELHEQMEEIPSDYYPPIIIKKENVENVYFKRKKLREEIVERFEWTLNLDSRYEVIAYIVALKSIETSNFIGLSISDIKNLSESWKKGLFSDSGSLDEYTDITDEMVSLGILRKSDKSLYLIKNSNVLQLLGNKGQIETKLLNISENKLPEQFPAYNYRSYSNDNPSKFSPLEYSQEGKFFELSNKVILILGSSALGINNVSEFTKRTCENSNVECFFHSLESFSVFEIQQKIDEFISKEFDGKSVLLFESPSFPDKNILSRAIDSLNAKKTIKNFKKIVFVSHSDSLWSYFRHEREFIDSLRKTKGLDIVNLSKIKDYFVQILFKHNMISLKLADCIKTFGFWSYFYNFLIIPDRKYKEKLKEIELYLCNKEKKDEILNLFGINNEEILSVLKLISDMEFESIEEFRCLADSSDHFELIESVISWGIETSIINYSKGKYTVDPIILKLIEI